MERDSEEQRCHTTGNGGPNSNVLSSMGAPHELWGQEAANDELNRNVRHSQQALASPANMWLPHLCNRTRDGDGSIHTGWSPGSHTLQHRPAETLGWAANFLDEPMLHQLPPIVNHFPLYSRLDGFVPEQVRGMMQADNPVPPSYHPFPSASINSRLLDFQQRQTHVDVSTPQAYRTPMQLSSGRDVVLADQHLEAMVQLHCRALREKRNPESDSAYTAAPETFQSSEVPIGGKLVPSQEKAKSISTVQTSGTTAASGQRCTHDVKEGYEVARKLPEVLPGEPRVSIGEVLKTLPKPSRTLTAYNIFFREERKRMIEEYEAGKNREDHCGKSDPLLSRRKARITFQEMGKIVGARWKRLTNEEKEPYLEGSLKDKVRFAKEMESYNARREELILAYQADQLAKLKTSALKTYYCQHGLDELKPSRGSNMDPDALRRGRCNSTEERQRKELKTAPKKHPPPSTADVINTLDSS